MFVISNVFVLHLLCLLFVMPSACYVFCLFYLIVIMYRVFLVVKGLLYLLVVDLSYICI